MKTAEPVQGNVLSPQPIMELASGFMRSRAFLTACELDLFTAVGDGDVTSAEVARTLGTDRRATDRLMNVLCSLGLLQKAADRFRNEPAAARFLVRDAPEYLGGLMHWVHLWESWSTLTPAVRHGGAVAAAPVDDRGEQWLRAFIAAMHWRACQHAPAVVAALDLTAVSRVLDVGGGSGAYAMEFARATPGLRAVVFDLPNVLPLTAEYLAQAGLADRVALVAGDFDRDDLGGGFDLVFLSAIIHSNSPDGNRALIRKGAAALNPPRPTGRPGLHRGRDADRAALRRALCAQHARRDRCGGHLHRVGGQAMDDGGRSFRCGADGHGIRNEPAHRPEGQRHLADGSLREALGWNSGANSH